MRIDYAKSLSFLFAVGLLAAFSLSHRVATAAEETPPWAVGLKALADENGMEFPWNEWDALIKAADDSLTSDTLDRDGDGLFMNTDPNDYNPDVDNDGFTDGYEIMNGSDPESAASMPVLGDVNNDGETNNLDASMLFYDIFGNQSEPLNLERAEINLDGKLSNLDAIVLFHWLLRNIPLIPNPALPERVLLVKQTGDGQYNSIQQAIDASTTGSTVIVYPGTYYENIRMPGWDITLTSTDPESTPTVAATVIDGSLSGSVVRFAGTESSECLFTGFTLTRGFALVGAGVYGNGALATMRNNRIIDIIISLEDCDEGIDVGGAGFYDCDGAIVGNYVDVSVSRIFCGELSIANGSFCYNCDGIISGNQVTGGAERGFITQCNAFVEKNMIIGGEQQGNPALVDFQGVASGNLFVNNLRPVTGALSTLSNCKGVFANNTMYASVGVAPMVDNCSGAIVNCIVWVGDEYMKEDFYEGLIVSSATPENCCVQDWTPDDRGNIAGDPLFVNPTDIRNGFQLQSDSPCIDSGKRITGIITDLRGAQRPVLYYPDRGDGSGYDMGAFEFQSESGQ